MKTKVPQLPKDISELKRGQIGVKVGDGFDAAEIVLQGDVLVGSVSVFIGETEADQNAGDLKGVVHLRDERDGATFADENSFLAEALFQCGLGLLENRIVVGSDPRFPHAQDFELAMDRFGKKLSHVLLDQFGDLFRILIGDETRGEFGKGF